MKRPLTFSAPRTILTDTNEARASAEREFKEIVRDAVEYFGPKWVRNIVSELTKKAVKAINPTKSAMPLC
jgi:hypothetical protein